MASDSAFLNLEMIELMMLMFALKWCWRLGLFSRALRSFRAMTVTWSSAYAALIGCSKCNRFQMRAKLVWSNLKISNRYIRNMVFEPVRT